MTLQATTCLGENTVPLLRDVVASLRTNGHDVVFDESLDWGEREAAFVAGEMDLVWACGLLTMRCLAQGLEMDIVAAPVFEGESEPVYRSVVIARADSGLTSIEEAFPRRLAINEFGSWSGNVGLDRWLRTAGHSIDDFQTTVVSGSHQNSMWAVRDGVADVAAIDHTIWDFRDHTDFANVHVLTTTDDWPAPPFSVSLAAVDVVADLQTISGIQPTTATSYIFMTT